MAKRGRSPFAFPKQRGQRPVFCLGGDPGQPPVGRSGTATEPALRNPGHTSPPAKGASRKFIETARMRRASHAKTKKLPPTISTT
jgi:hypothetical protein